MHLMLAVRQGLTAVDAIMRECAREHGLERSEALVLGLVEARPRRSASELAVMTGQPRQHALRTLRKLQKRGLVEPVGTLRNKVIGWGLTPSGEKRWRELSRQLREYEEIVNARVSLQELVESLERVVESVVNRPGSRGWRRGLVRPMGSHRPEEGES